MQDVMNLFEGVCQGKSIIDGTDIVCYDEENGIKLCAYFYSDWELHHAFVVLYTEDKSKKATKYITNIISDYIDGKGFSECSDAIDRVIGELEKQL